ncbi:hypothetical protein SNO29_000742 [Cronobacter sakazakii]|nr:hypothetical protein [Cronobacter sakazakii]
MTGSIDEIIEKLQTRILAYEILFQSLLEEVPAVLKERVVDNARHHFAGLEAGVNSDPERAQKITAARAVVEQLLAREH